MNFDKQYLTISNAIDDNAFIEASELYVELLKFDKQRILETCQKHEIAKYIHYRLASQFALQKLLIQRLQGKTTLDLNLDLFTKRLPLRLRYDSVTTEFLSNWKKDTYKSFSVRKRMVQNQYNEISEKYLGTAEHPQVIDADVYSATWVVPDFLNLEEYLPESPSGYVNLGCGAGLFDCVFLRKPRNKIPTTLIDIDPECNRSISQLISIHELEQTSFNTGWTEECPAPSIVLSIRSCGFLYSVNVYDSLFRSLETGSKALLEVGLEYIQETVDYFESLNAHIEKHELYNSKAATLFEVTI